MIWSTKVAERLEQVLDTPSKERKYENVQELQNISLISHRGSHHCDLHNFIDFTKAFSLA